MESHNNESGRSGMGREITLEEFRAMDEKEKFVHVFAAVKAITHLEKASKVATTKLERARSIFGVYNFKKNMNAAREYYDNNT